MIKWSEPRQCFTNCLLTNIILLFCSVIFYIRKYLKMTGIGYTSGLKTFALSVYLCAAVRLKVFQCFVESGKYAKFILSSKKVSQREVMTLVFIIPWPKSTLTATKTQRVFSRRISSVIVMRWASIVRSATPI
jgi:hypothetical protein